MDVEVSETDRCRFSCHAVASMPRCLPTLQ
jgi:hypothetical protein